jgi:hypothetical protein
VNLPRRRRSRPRGRARLALTGDFPATDRDITEAIEAAGPAPWDGATVPLSALRGESHYTPGDFLPPGVIPVAIKQRGQDTDPFARLRAPAAFPALPPAPPPQRQPDCAIPTINRDGSIGLLCGIDLWRIHFDPEAARARHGFDALRSSALTAGWRPDAYGRWACPRCKMNPAYATPQPLAHYHPGAYGGRGRMMTGHGGYRDAQFWLQVQAEHEVLRRTRDGATHGRHHRAGA